MQVTSTQMKRVEQHVIKKNHEWFDYCNQITNASRQLFNAANYVQRQGFFYHHGTQSQASLDKMFQSLEAYKAMPCKVSQLVLKQSADSWKAYFQAIKAYSQDKSKFTGRPKIPGYVLKRNLVKFNTQAISRREFKQGYLVPSMSPIKIPVKPGIKLSDVCEVRIVPKVGCFVVEVVYEESVVTVPTFTDSTRACAIDIGLDNLATIVFNDGQTPPIIINGKPLKSENQYYNKQIASLKGFLPEGIFTSSRIVNIIRNRNHFVNTYLHQCSRIVVKELFSQGVQQVAIGKNEQWKTSIDLGKRVNQSFVQIPHARFIEMLTDKLTSVGIKVVVGEESYTSKASFLDWDNIPTYTPNNHERYKFSGQRVSRSWYVSSDGTKIHADVQAAFNIGRKVIPTEFDALKSIVQRDRGCLVVHPRRITPIFRRVHAQPGVA